MSDSQIRVENQILSPGILSGGDTPVNRCYTAICQVSGNLPAKQTTFANKFCK